MNFFSNNSIKRIRKILVLNGTIINPNNIDYINYTDEIFHFSGKSYEIKCKNATSILEQLESQYKKDPNNPIMQIDCDAIIPDSKDT